MTQVNDLMPSGDRMKKALCWIKEMLEAHPGKSRQQIIDEAQIRFDLSPRECDFIDRRLRDDGSDCS